MKRITMKNLLLRALFGASAGASLLALSPSGRKWLLVFAVLGAACALFLMVRDIRPRRSERRAVNAAAALLAFPVCVSLARSFYNTWLYFDGVERVASAFGLTREALLTGLAVFLGVAALPFAFLILSHTFGLFERFLPLIHWQLLLQELRPASWKSFLKGALCVLLNILLAALLGTALLTILFLPESEQTAARLERNAVSSAVTFQEEGLYPNLFPWCESRLDNFTDAIMILEAADLVQDTPLRRSLLVYRRAYTEADFVNPCKTITRHYLQGEEYTGFYTYPRYWHGYLLLVKPLLTLMDYSAMRLLNGITQTLLSAAILLLLRRRGLTRCILPYLISLLMLMPMAMAYSFQYSTCFYVFSVGAILLLSLGPRVGERRVCGALFLNIGIALAFFDFLTYPVAAFGVPAVFYLCLRGDDPPERRLSALVRSGVLWCTGYIGMWGLKWIIAGVLTGEDVLGNALTALATRTSGFNLDKTVRYSLIQVERTNITDFLRTPATLLVLAFVVWCLFRLHRERECLQSQEVRQELLLTAMPFLLVALLPMLWYAFATNHSGIHHWFTSRACIVSVLSCMCALSTCCQKLSSARARR